MKWQTAGRVAALGLFTATLAALAISQAYVVHDLIRVIHGSWPLWATWAMAGGFGGAVLSVAFGLAILGHDRGLALWGAEGLLVALSVAAGAIGVMKAGHDPYTVAVVSLLPLQYLAVAEAARRVLMRWWPRAEPAAMATVATVAAPALPAVTVTTPRPRRLTATQKTLVAEGWQVAMERPAPAATAATATVAPAMAPRRASGDDQEMTAERMRLAQQYAVTAGRVGDSAQLVAQALGRPPRTVRRWRLDADAMGLL